MCTVIVGKLIQNRINRPWNCDRNSASEAILQAMRVFKWVTMSLQDPEKQRTLNKVKYSWSFFLPRFSRWENTLRNKQTNKNAMWFNRRGIAISSYSVYNSSMWNLCHYSPAPDMMSECLNLTELSVCVLHPRMKQDKGDVVVLSDVCHVV